MKTKLHFLHIGKTGGTAVRTALQTNSNSGRYTIVFHDHSFGLRQVPTGEKFFFFLRDPVSRFASGFNSRKRCGRPKYYFPWSPAESVAFTKFDTPNQLAESLTAHDADIRKSAHAAMRGIGHVNRSVWAWLANEKYFQSRSNDLLFIGFQETLTCDFTKLLELLELPSTIGLPKDDVSSHRNPPDMDCTISGLGRANLEAHFAEDYAL